MPDKRTYSLVETTREATHYYIIPQHNTLIPKCSNAQRVLITLLSTTRDVHSYTRIEEYPIVTRKHANLFKDWRTVSVKVHYTKHVTPQEAAKLSYQLSKLKHQNWLDSLGIDFDNL